MQTHYRYENARRNRVYGKPIPNTRIDTSELADRVGHYHLSGDHSIEKVFRTKKMLTGAWLPLHCLTLKEKKAIPYDLAWYSIRGANGQTTVYRPTMVLYSLLLLHVEPCNRFRITRLVGARKCSIAFFLVCL